MNARPLECSYPSIQLCLGFSLGLFPSLDPMDIWSDQWPPGGSRVSTVHQIGHQVGYGNCYLYWDPQVWWGSGIKQRIDQPKVSQRGTRRTWASYNCKPAKWPDLSYDGDGRVLLDSLSVIISYLYTWVVSSCFETSPAQWLWSCF